MGQNVNNLRVALLGDYSPDVARIRGGVQAATSYLVKGLTRIEGLELHVLTLRQSDWSGPNRIDHHGMTIHLLPVFPRFERLRNYRNFQRIINQKLSQIQPDIVHAQGAGMYAYVALRSGYPSVVTVHGIRYEDSKYCSSWGRRIRLLFDSIFTERYVMKQTKHLIAISNYVSRYFSSLIRPDLLSYTIPNAIDERFFDLTDNSKEPVVFFAGRVTPLKRVLDLIRAFELVVQQLPSAQLRIAGECNSEPGYVGSIRHWIHQANLGENVHLLGLLPEDVILREFSRCSLLALPSSQENTPMVIAQAMAAGKPVVATRVGGITEMLGREGERGILCDVGDIVGLSMAMLCLLQDTSLRLRLGQAGQAYAKEYYNQDRVAQLTWEVYNQIVTRDHTSSA